MTLHVLELVAIVISFPYVILKLIY